MASTCVHFNYELLLFCFLQLSSPLLFPQVSQVLWNQLPLQKSLLYLINLFPYFANV